MTTQAPDIATRLEVEDTVVRMFVATDERDWTTLQDCFTNPITLDMTSMAGGVPEILTPADVARAWSDGFVPLDAVHHQVGNMRTEVNGDSASVRCHGIALHHRSAAPGIKTRLFVGTYELQLQRMHEKWRISHLVYRLKFIDGNTKLEAGT